MMHPQWTGGAEPTRMAFSVFFSLNPPSWFDRPVSELTFVAIRIVGRGNANLPFCQRPTLPEGEGVCPANHETKNEGSQNADLAQRSRIAFRGSEACF